MRIAALVALAAKFPLSRFFAPSDSAALASPCVTSTTPCEQWITLGGGPARSMV